MSSHPTSSIPSAPVSATKDPAGQLKIATSISIAATLAVLAIIFIPPVSAAIGLTGLVTIILASGGTATLVNSFALVSLGIRPNSNIIREDKKAASPVITPPCSDSKKPDPRVEIKISIAEAKELQKQTNEKQGKIYNGTIDNKPVQFYIASNQWQWLDLTQDEVDSGEVDLAKHLNELHFESTTNEPFVFGSYGNGIKTPINRFLEGNQLLTNTLDSQNTPFLVLSLYNPTEGPAKDIWRAFKERRRIETPIVTNTRQFMIWTSTLFSEHDDVLELALRHSENGVITKRAIEGMCKEDQERIQKKLHICAVGPAIPLKNGQALSVKNYYSKKDFITGPQTPWGPSRTYLTDPDKYRIKYKPCISARRERFFKMADHGFLKPTYKAVVSKWVKRKISEKKQSLSRASKEAG